MKDFFKKIITSKKGVAIELAIGVLLLSVAFCMLILNFTVYQNNNKKRVEKSTGESVELMQITDDFCRLIKGEVTEENFNEKFSNSYGEKYVYELDKSEEKPTLKIKSLKGEQILLIELEKSYGNGYTIIGWQQR